MVCSLNTYSETKLWNEEKELTVRSSLKFVLNKYDEMFCLQVASYVYRYENSNYWKQVGYFQHFTLGTPKKFDLICDEFSGHLYFFGWFLHKSSDAGKTWVQLDPGFYTYAFTSNKMGELIVSADKGIYLSDDFGKTFTLQSPINKPLDTLASMLCDLNGNVLGINSKNIWKSTNKGKDWNAVSSPVPINSITSMKISASGKYYLTSYGKGVYVSDNGGSSWKNITFDIANIFVNTIYIDISENIYVGSERGLFKLEPNSTNWKDMAEGLPISPISAITIDIDGFLHVSTKSFGTFKRYSSLKPPSKVNLINPINDNKLPDTSVVFKWNIAKYAVKYNIQISKDATFDNIYFTCDTISDTLVKVNFSSRSDYYWRVQAINEGGLSALSEEWHLKLIAVPEIPKLTFPFNNSTVGLDSIDFKWGSAKFSNSYRFQLSSDNSFTNIVHDSLLNSTNILLTKLKPSTTFFWRVKSLNLDTISNWSTIWYFLTSKFSQVDLFEDDSPFLLDLQRINENKIILRTNSYFINVNKIVIYDINGLIVKTEALLRECPEFEIDVSLLPPGLYFVRIGDRVSKFIKL